MRSRLTWKKKWDFTPVVTPAQGGGRRRDWHRAGDAGGAPQDRGASQHGGTITDIRSGSFTVEETVATAHDKGRTCPDHGAEVAVRIGRPYKHKYPQAAAVLRPAGRHPVPIARARHRRRARPFGSGKTVVQHQLAKWADVDIVVYIGGEATR